MVSHNQGREESSRRYFRKVLLFVGWPGVVVVPSHSASCAAPRLAFVAEQVVDFEQGGSYALWLTGGVRGFWARLLAEVYPNIALIDSSTGDAIAITYPTFPVMIHGFGTYRQFAIFAIERPGRYILRIIGPATQRSGASATRLILERRRG